jgi:hypothetical protein
VSFLVVLIFVFIKSVWSNSDNCTCLEPDFVPTEFHGSVVCTSNKIRLIMECDKPFPPQCICPEKYTGIENDSNGTRCIFAENGETVEKSPCENIEEIEEYERKYNQVEE